MNRRAFVLQGIAIPVAWAFQDPVQEIEGYAFYVGPQHTVFVNTDPKPTFTSSVYVIIRNLQDPTVTMIGGEIRFANDPGVVTFGIGNNPTQDYSYAAVALPSDTVPSEIIFTKSVKAPIGKVPVYA